MLHPWVDDPDQAGPADGDDNDTTCTERWKAAMSDQYKKMWNVFRESGIFISACRHGLIWQVVDMIRSGELYVDPHATSFARTDSSVRAKYPLAILHKLLTTFGDRLGVGYDIGCSFWATVMKSSLKELALAGKLRMCVPAFHAYAHNRKCQLNWHPLYITGFGIEDLEICEKVFSFLNGVARLTRHGTGFHRHQFIDMALAQWDADKEQEISESNPLSYALVINA